MSEVAHLLTQTVIEDLLLYLLTFGGSGSSSLGVSHFPWMSFSCSPWKFPFFPLLPLETQALRGGALGLLCVASLTCPVFFP